jgi:DNA-binding NarL/FixJ family response regulator
MAGRSPTTVMKILHEQSARHDSKIVLDTTVGLDSKVHPNRLYDTTERDIQIRELLASGKSMRQIAGRNAVLSRHGPPYPR